MSCSSSRWAPNHHRTNPWRFRVLGPETLERLKEAAGPAEAPKLERAPTLVVASAVLIGDLEQDEEDVCATASAIYAVLLAAHARGPRGLLADTTGAPHEGGARRGRLA
jgi:nitroreductase